MEREWNAEAVRTVVFGKPSLGRRGYDQDQVDAYRQVIADALDGRARLSADDVHTVAFKKPPMGKRGYDEEQVDAFLDSIEARLRARGTATASAADTPMTPATARAEAPDAINQAAADTAAAADAAWFAAKFGSTRPAEANPDADAPRGLRRLFGSGARGRRTSR